MKLEYNVDYYEKLMEKYDSDNVRFFNIEATRASEVVDKIIEKYIDEIGDFRNDEFFDMEECKKYLHSILNWKGAGIYDMHNLNTEQPSVDRIDSIIDSILKK